MIYIGYFIMVVPAKDCFECHVLYFRTVPKKKRLRSGPYISSESEDNSESPTKYTALKPRRSTRSTTESETEERPIQSLASELYTALSAENCLVCGATPAKQAYNVMCCNGCKAFFRRTVTGKC